MFGRKVLSKLIRRQMRLAYRTKPVTPQCFDYDEKNRAAGLSLFWAVRFRHGLTAEAENARRHMNVCPRCRYIYCQNYRGVK